MAEIEGTHGIPRYARSLANELQQFIHGIGELNIVHKIHPNSAYSYSGIVIIWINK